MKTWVKGCLIILVLGLAVLSLSAKGCPWLPGYDEDTITGSSTPFASAVSNLTITVITYAITDTQIALAWQDNSNNEDGVKIERKTGAEGTYTEIDSVGANVTSYDDTDLTYGTIYYYRIRAYNTNGYSMYSNEVFTMFAVEWTEKIAHGTPGSPPARQDPIMVWDGTKVILFGGSDTSSTTANDLWWYYPITNTWVEKIANGTPGSPATRYGHSMVWDGTKVIMFGGSDNASVYKNDLWWYYPITNTWVEKIAQGTPGSPVSRWSSSMVWDDTKVIMFGGYNSGGNKNNLWWYYPITNTWVEKIADGTVGSPLARGSHEMVWDGTKVIMFGGFNGDNNNDLWWYDPNSNTWTEKIAHGTAGSPQGIAVHAMVWGGTRAILFGGFDVARKNDLWWYDPGTNTWTEKIAHGTVGSPPARTYHRMVWAGTKVIMFGGTTGGRRNDLWWYEP